MLNKNEKNIKKLIKKCDNVFITGHKNLDLDAIGSCIGISAICNFFNKENYIIVDDKEHEIGVSKIIEEVKEKNRIIKKPMQQIVNGLILSHLFCRRAFLYSVLCTISGAVPPRTFSVLQSCIPGQKAVICDYENAAAYRTGRSERHK